MEETMTSQSGAAQEMRNKADDLKRDVREFATAAGAMARERLDPLENYIRDYPIRSILIAGGCGMLLATLFRAR
jgi:ElaB/YqjD/DUF883 family membrane-anchored ribosome-binding protein